MKFDLFMEFASPPFNCGTAADAYKTGIETAVAADRLGFDAIWSAEHHFVGDYSRAAAPEMLLSAISQVTQKIGLGFGILPLPLYNPIIAAEKLATLDALSQGRVLWGVGRGVTKMELGGFGVDMSDSRQMFLEKFSELAVILKTGKFERNEEIFELSPRPSSELGKGWMATVSPESIDIAVDLNLNIMTGPFKPWAMVERDIKRYRNLMAKKGQTGEASFTLAVFFA